MDDLRDELTNETTRLSNKLDHLSMYLFNAQYSKYLIKNKSALNDLIRDTLDSTF